MDDQTNKAWKIVDNLQNQKKMKKKELRTKKQRRIKLIQKQRTGIGTEMK